MGFHVRSGLGLLLVLIGGASADAQVPRRAAQNPATLLARCTSVPDPEACRAVLVLPISAGQRSLALTYLAESEMNMTDSLLREAVRSDSTNALAHAMLGIRAVGWGHSEGIGHLRRAVALRPDWRHLHRRIATAYGAIEPAQRDTAERLWRAAIAAEPTEPANHIGLAAVLARSDRLAAAEASFRRATALDATEPVAIAGICEMLLRQRRVPEAQAPCASAIRGWTAARGTDVRLILHYAEEARDYQLALAAAEAGLAADPTSMFFRSDRTRLLHSMGREAEAEALLRQYVTEHAFDWNAVEELADYLFWREQFGDARELYLRMVDPACPNTGFACTVKGNLAMASLRTGMLDDAFRYLTAALEHQIDCPDLLASFRRHAGARPDSGVVLARLQRTLAGISDTVATRHGAGGAADFFATIGEWDRAAQYYRIALDSAAIDEREGRPRRFAFGLRWEYGRALVEQGRHCDGLRELTMAQAAEPIFESGRPYLTNALARAKERCREDAR